MCPFQNVVVLEECIRRSQTQRGQSTFWIFALSFLEGDQTHFSFPPIHSPVRKPEETMGYPLMLRRPHKRFGRLSVRMSTDQQQYSIDNQSEAISSYACEHDM